MITILILHLIFILVLVYYIFIYKKSYDHDIYNSINKLYNSTYSVENFSNKIKKYDTRLFVKIKISILMILILLYASYQNYGLTEDRKLLTMLKLNFNSLIFLCYVISLMIFMYMEMENLYNN